MGIGIELHALRAAHGDSFILSYLGEDREQSFVIIDGGPKKTFKESLRPRIDALIKEKGIVHVRLCLLTHCDDDHVGGLIEFFKNISKYSNKLSITEVWMNAFPTRDKINPIGVDPKKAFLESAKQGYDLLGMVRGLSIPVNWSTTMSLGRDGIEATVVAPNAKALEALSKVMAQPSSVQAMVASYDDKSPTNLSSIVVLFEKKSVKLLMCGDALGNHVLEGLENTGKLAKDGTLSLDLLKIPHHGGENNCTQDFFERLPAKNYLISTDGAKFPHPHPAMLADLFAARKAILPNDPFKIHLTYDIDELGEKADVPAIKAAIAKAEADGLEFTVEKITGPLSF